MVEEIESAIEQLPSQDKWRLLIRFYGALWSEWDKQIEGDAVAGRLNHIVQEVEADVGGGSVLILRITC